MLQHVLFTFAEHTCKDFTCATREFCINPDLLCDGVNHCGDNSDESVQNLCQSKWPTCARGAYHTFMLIANSIPDETTSTVFGVDMTWFVLIVVGVLLVLSALIVAIAICVCRRQDENAANQNTALQRKYSSHSFHHLTIIMLDPFVAVHHNAETNGSSKHLHYHGVGMGMGMGVGGTLTREHTQLPPVSGNWHHPAGPSGYHRIPHNYLKMATKVRPIWCLANSVN